MVGVDVDNRLAAYYSRIDGVVDISEGYANDKTDNPSKVFM